jgi:Flp pilus assembly protein TadD
MSLRIVALALLVTTTHAHSRDKAEGWIQVQSPHFLVATNGSEKQGRRTADQFERMRSVFHAAFPKLELDPGAPIIVLAIKDEKDFKTLEPQEYLAKGSLKLGGLFLRGPDKNYVLMRLDAEGEHPYAVVYHEYTHLLISQSSESAEWMPLWMNEGLAEFYENTEIEQNEALLGKPSFENIQWLRQNRLLPLATLFTVDHNSPYYHEEKKGSIFYAESWALTHYILVTDALAGTHRMTDYENLLAQKVDRLEAATRAFGDLQQLESQLDKYVGQKAFRYSKVRTTTEVDDSAFKVQTLTPSQSDSLRADFLAYNHRTADAEVLLDRLLQEDPKNVSALETKGFLSLQRGHEDAARKWYEQAVQLDSQSYIAHYYFASLAMASGSDFERDRAESSLRESIKLNPKFAPPFDRLAVLLGMQRKNLDDARMMGLTAITLDPSNVGYRINVANLLMAMDKSDTALQVLQAASKVAQTPEDSKMVADALTRAHEFMNAQAQISDQQSARDGSINSRETTDANIPTLKHRDFVPKGPHRFALGTLKKVICENPGMDLTVVVNGKTLPLHADNYYKIPFSALGFHPSSDLNPCADLENRPAKVEYVESANPSVSAQLISVELHK